jgi:hypothetical protein
MTQALYAHMNKKKKKKSCLNDVILQLYAFTYSPSLHTISFNPTAFQKDLFIFQDQSQASSLSSKLHITPLLCPLTLTGLTLIECKRLRIEKMSLTSLGNVFTVLQRV